MNYIPKFGLYDVSKPLPRHDFSAFEDAIMSLHTWGSIVLVYSGSRWFGTLEFSYEKDFNRLASLCKYCHKKCKRDSWPLLISLIPFCLIDDEEYHAFWDDLYNGKTYFVR